MMRKNIIMMLVGVILCAGIIGARILYKATAVSVEIQRLDDAIASVDVTIEEARKARELHTQQTIEKVVVIREQVRQEILALDPDGLCALARDEIAIFRGRSTKDRLDPSSPGMDGQ